MTIAHVDMDAFFASVEIRDRPELAGRPVLVGGAGRRGVVAAANYAARVYGCHSAQPMAVALRRCPHAVVVPPRFEAYEEASRQAFAVFERYSPRVEALSIDEAFLDLIGTERLLGPAPEVAERIRAEVRAQTGGLTCSVGLSEVKFIAKIASDMNKPDGLTVVPSGGELEFLRPLPIGKLWGVGPKTRETLGHHGIRTIGDLDRLGRERLVQWFGEHGERLWRLSRAIDPRPVEPLRSRKQVSHEDTYAEDLRGRRQIEAHLLSQATRVADRLVSKGIRGRVVQLKIRDVEFMTQTRRKTLAEPTDEAAVIYRVACDLLAGLDLEHRRFRLTGVGVGGLVRPEREEPRQLELGWDGESGSTEANDGTTKGQRLQGVLSQVRERFGHRALYPADAGGDRRPGSAGGLTRTLDED